MLKKIEERLVDNNEGFWSRGIGECGGANLCGGAKLPFYPNISIPVMAERFCQSTPVTVERISQSTPVTLE